MKKSESYKNALKQWLSFSIKEPHNLFSGSLFFLLFCLPVITYGPAKLALTRYMSRRNSGVNIKWTEAVRFGFQKKAWLMGFSDFLAVTLIIGSLYAVFFMELPGPIRFLYGTVLFIDLIYLLSSVYRYPALASNNKTKTSMLMMRGFLLALGNLGWTLMFGCAQLLFFMLCLATGAGVILLYPAGQVLLSDCAYREMIKNFNVSSVLPKI